MFIRKTINKHSFDHKICSISEKIIDAESQAHIWFCTDFLYIKVNEINELKVLSFSV